MAPSAEPGISRRTVQAMLWAYGSFVAGRALTLLSTAVLAHLLAPRDFGLVALALVVIAVLETVADIGLSQALVIADRRELQERADTAFLSSIAIGALVAAAVAALGPALASFFDEPSLSYLVPLLGANFLLRSLGSTHDALAERALDFRSRTWAEVAAGLVRGGAAIALAAAGLGAVSIVVGYLAGTAMLSAVLWLLVPWRPRLRAQLRHLREMVRFGVSFSGVDLLAALSNNVDYVFIGWVLGPASVGLYAIGFRLPELLVMNLVLVAGRVLFPAFAAVPRQALPAAFLAALRYTVMLAVPLAVGLAALAHPLVLALFGARWEAAATPMLVLTVYAVGLTLNIPAGAVYKATGRAHVLLALALPRLAVLVVSIALLVDRGIVAVAACQAAAAMLVALLSTVLAVRLLGVSPRELRSALWPPLVAAGPMGAVMVAVAQSLPPWPALAAGALLGGAVYVGVLWLVAREALDHLWARLRPLSAVSGAA
ncbi:MAG TPA: oligosaccharide flippase family protein [Solirubrobacteraceae bacterium]|nr:oligosaccharide flippase family protein [Solirubrobacteraceae bacterium]